MPFRRPVRWWSVLAAAGTALTVAGCGQITPLNGDQPTPKIASAAPRIIGTRTVVVPRPGQLPSPFVLEAVTQVPARAGRCPAGSVALSGGPGQCYREVGKPVTFTVAGISAILPELNGRKGFFISLPASAQQELTAVTTRAFNADGFLDIRVAGRTLLLPRVAGPFTRPVFEISLLSAAETLLLHRLLSQ